MAARKSKAKSKAKPPAKKSAKPKKAEAKAPLAEMDKAWQELLETALAKHRAQKK